MRVLVGIPVYEGVQILRCIILPSCTLKLNSLALLRFINSSDHLFVCIGA